MLEAISVLNILTTFTIWYSQIKISSVTCGSKSTKGLMMYRHVNILGPSLRFSENHWCCYYFYFVKYCDLKAILFFIMRSHTWYFSNTFLWFNCVNSHRSLFWFLTKYSLILDIWKYCGISSFPLTLGAYALSLIVNIYELALLYAI